MQRIWYQLWRNASIAPRLCHEIARAGSLSQRGGGRPRASKFRYNGDLCQSELAAIGKGGLALARSPAMKTTGSMIAQVEDYCGIGAPSDMPCALKAESS